LQRFDQYDITVRVPVFQSQYCRCYGLIGPRHVAMWERFLWRTVAEDFTGNAGSDDVALYTNIVSNRLYGVDAGLGTEWYIAKGFSLSVDGRAAAMMDIAHLEARYERGDFAIENKRSRREYSFAPELDGNVNLWWYPIAGVELRVGYEIMSFFNTFSSPRPVTFSYGGMDPTYSRTTYRFFDGFNAGIGFIF
jgi:hypothetical protein